MSRTFFVPWRPAAATVALLTLTHLCTAQVIVSLEPAYGSPGEPVTIMGSGFYPGTLTVRFGGPNGPIDGTARAVSATTIYARVPNGASTGPVYVQVGNSGAWSVQDFTVLGLGPFLIDFAPHYGAVSQIVTIQGWHLGNLSSVKFGGKASTSFMPNANGSQISATVPSGAVTGRITVTTAYGTSNTVGDFTVIGPGPYVDIFAPMAGSAGTQVLLDGIHFTGVTNVSFNGRKSLSFFVQSDIRILAFVPSDVVSGPITVASSKGIFTTPDLFFVQPAITGFSPVIGRAGTNISITGSNLLGITDARVGAQPAMIVAATNNTTLLIRAPSNAPSGPLRINSPAFSFITTTNFRFLPVVTSLSPATGSNGTTVVFTGSNLDEGLTNVTFNGVSSPSNKVISAQSITAVVPAGASNGYVSLFTTNGSFTISNLFYLPPAVTGLSSTNAAPGSAVVITGKNFLGTTNVSFGGVNAAFTVPTNNLQLLVKVPTNFPTAEISVATPGGIATTTLFYGLPTFAQFQPLHGVPGDNIEILGANFTGATAVKFQGVNATFTVVNPGKIVAKVPAGAGSGPISVTTPGGTVTSTNQFLVDLASDLGLSGDVTASPVFTGSNLVFTLTVTNTGPFDAPDVRLVNELPPGVVLRSNHVSRGMATVNGSTVTAAFGLVAVSNSASLRLFTTAVVPGTLLNKASVSGDYADPDTNDNTNTLSVLALPLPLLSMQPYSAGQWMVSWPVLLTNYSPQYRAGFGTGQNWSNLTTVPAILGTNRYVIEPTAEGFRFYRLKYP